MVYGSTIKTVPLPPQNRDKLELYALHKQAVSGDAPSSLSTATAAERAKFNAWKSKAGLSSQEAMRMYIQESDRQVRVYGLAPSQQPQQLPGNGTAENPNEADASAVAYSGGSATAQQQQPRGLSAIPLLCAAASESRSAYLRRLANTQPHQSWWNRQEALCAVSSASLWALPETILIKFAGFLELIALSWDGPIIPQPVLQSFLWPLHNVCLALWMAIILVSTSWTALAQVGQTMIWGSRRTGLQLTSIWKDCIVFASTSRLTLTEPHQPLSARLVGLSLLPMSLIIMVTGRLPVVWGSTFYVVAFMMTWWYWFLVLPWLAACLIGAAIVAGNCFALIELAGV